jgi:hypothetical protein
MPSKPPKYAKSEYISDTLLLWCAPGGRVSCCLELNEA